LDEAIACHRQAIALDPRYALAHNALGVALADKGQLDEAIGCFRKAVALDPRHAGAHYNLGNALKEKGPSTLDEAIACYRQAVALDPRYALAHHNLGVALSDKGQLDEAIGCFRQAVALDPRLAQAHGALGDALLHKGSYAEARELSAHALRLLPDKHPLRSVASRQLQTCERLLKLEGRLPSLLSGEDQPSSVLECCDLGRVCRDQQRYTRATRFYADAFTRQPSLADDLTAGYRYAAACSAALAAAGEGRDAASLGALDRQALRRQALTWLRADLDRWRTLADKEDSRVRQQVAQKLRHWRQDADLAGLRDAEALKSLPAEERQACERLWADVEALLRKVQPK
jgi:tetratricopeptide (TPR) repeat protein